MPGHELDWQEWLGKYAPVAASKPLAQHHKDAWEWFESLENGVKPPAYIACWNRGAGKSTTVEIALARQSVLAKRKFALYFSATQEAANRHVQAIGNRMEKLGIERAVNKYGNAKGWNAQLLRTANGFNILALGHDATVRGIKLEEYRPDIIILDDIDSITDSLEVVESKIQTLTASILPAGSTDCAVAFFQNAMHQHSIMTRCIENTADFLRNRYSFTPIKAVDGLTYDLVQGTDEDAPKQYRITAGTATWQGKPIETCEFEMNEFGIVSFLRECQHDTGIGGKFFQDWQEKRGEKDWHAIYADEADVQPYYQFFGGFDWGYRSPSVFLLMCADTQGCVTVIDEWHETSLTDPEQAAKCVEMIRDHGLKLENVPIYADPSMFNPKTDYAGKKVENVRSFLAVSLRMIKASKDRPGGWQNVRRYMKDSTVDAAGTPKPFLRAIRGRCSNLLRTIPKQVFDPKTTEDLDTTGDDHDVDALRYGLSSRLRLPAIPKPRRPEDPPPPGMPDNRPSFLKEDKEEDYL